MPAHATICKGCWQNLHLPVPLRGLASAPFRALGIRPSRMNPNTCTICETMFERVMRARQVEVDATVLFADLRGYTGLSQSQSSGAISELLDAFYDVCATAIWEHDGIVNKTMGDALMSVFNFPIRRDDHPVAAIRAARSIQQRWLAEQGKLAAALGPAAAKIGVGVGIDSGKVNFGEFGRAHSDLTAIGNVVNVASRAQGVAAAGEILVTEAVRDRAGAEVAQTPPREYRLKGIAEPAKLWAA